MSDTALPATGGSLTPSPMVVSVAHGGATVLLDVVSGNYYSLNATATEIWKRLCDGRPLDTIIEEIAGLYRIDTATASRDVRALIAQCQDAQVIQ